jgi:hypothetical protein
MRHKFKNGDKVVFRRPECSRGVGQTWPSQAHLKLGKTYTVVGLDSIGSDANGLPVIRFRLTEGPYKGESWVFREDHFDLLKKTNAERIKEREAACDTKH